MTKWMVGLCPIMCMNHCLDYYVMNTAVLAKGSKYSLFILFPYAFLMLDVTVSGTCGDDGCVCFKDEKSGQFLWGGPHCEFQLLDPNQSSAWYVLTYFSMSSAM